MARTENPFGLWGNPILAAALIAAWITLVLVFNGEPQWDLAVARAFFDSDLCAATARQHHCHGFPVARSDIANAIRDALHYLPTAIGVILLFMIALDRRDGVHWQDAGLRMKTVLFAALVIGPGLLVNGILKTQWGRPRPWMTEDFGGSMPFVEAGVMEGMCRANCSFVSGEAAGGGWLLCLAALFPPELRRAAFLVLAIVGIAMALLRVAFGAHYLSDAVLGYLLSVTVFVVLAVLSQTVTGPARRTRV